MPDTPGLPCSRRAALCCAVPHQVAPICVYTSGKGSSAAGLTAAVVQDANSREFFLEVRRAGSPSTARHSTTASCTAQHGWRRGHMAGYTGTPLRTPQADGSAACLTALTCPGDPLTRPSPAGWRHGAG